MASADSKASQAVVEFEKQTYLPSDLAKFQENNGLPLQPVRYGIGPPVRPYTAFMRNITFRCNWLDVSHSGL